MISDTRVEDDTAYTLSRFKEKNVGRGDGRQGKLHEPAWTKYDDDGDT